MSFILGFDFGMNSIGTAIGNTATLTARPLKALKAKQGRPDAAALTALLKEWQPQLLVVGLPLNMDGTPMEITNKARHFGNVLHERTGLQVVFADERLTTKEAKAAIFAAGGFRALARDKGGIDCLSAALIVQEYLDRLTP